MNEMKTNIVYLSRQDIAEIKERFPNAIFKFVKKTVYIPVCVSDYVEPSLAEALKEKIK